VLFHLIMLIFISYTIFVFTSNAFNPFVIVKDPLKRRHWRLGRAAALASLVAGAVAVVLLDVYNLAARSALATYLILFGVFVLPSVLHYRKSSLWR